MSNILQHQSTHCRRRQADTSDSSYLALSTITHLYIAMIPSYVSREILSQRSNMEGCAGVDHPRAIFTCKICTCLFTNEQKFLIARRNGRSVLVIRNFPGFDIISDTLVFLQVSAVLLEMSRFSAIKAHRLTSGLRSGVGFVRSLRTSSSPVSSSVHVLSQIRLRLGQDSFVFPPCLLI